MCLQKNNVDETQMQKNKTCLDNPPKIPKSLVKNRLLLENVFRALEKSLQTECLAHNYHHLPSISKFIEVSFKYYMSEPKLAYWMDIRYQQIRKRKMLQAFYKNYIKTLGNIH